MPARGGKDAAMSNRRNDSASDQVAGPLDMIKRFGPPGLLIFVAALFVAQNTKSIEFSFLWVSFTAPLWLMLVGFAGVGALVSGLISWLRRKRKAPG